MSSSYGSVELIDSMGNDLRVVNSARVSYNKQSEWQRNNWSTEEQKLTKHLKEADAGLLNFLMREHHGTPFEMVVFTFRVKCPIGVAREWQRHRIGSFNEVSTRYVEMEQEFYVPEGNAVRTQVGKPGHYTFESLHAIDAEAVQATMRHAYNYAYQWYQELIHMDLAKEVARNVLPLGLMTQFYWTVNLRSLFNFLSLRTADSALFEIRELAKMVEELARPVVPECFSVFDKHGRAAP